jgi:ABC-type transport system substrate-binding protein
MMAALIFTSFLIPKLKRCGIDSITTSHRLKTLPSPFSGLKIVHFRRGFQPSAARADSSLYKKLIPYKFGWGASLTLALLLLVSTSIASADDGHGVIREANSDGASSLTILFPVTCDNAACARLNSLLFPTLFAYDPDTGIVEGAAPDNRALVLDPMLQDGNVQTLHLRDDLTWSDGTPITAYDVLFSYLLLGYANLTPFGYATEIPLSQQITGAQLIDEHTIAFAFSSSGCDSFARMNIPVAPAHVGVPEFSDIVKSISKTNEILSAKEWIEASQNYAIDANLSPFVLTGNLDPAVTGGFFTFESVRPGEDIRLLSDDLAYVYEDIPAGKNPVEMFLNGETNLLVNPEYERRDDLRAASGIQLAEMPSGSWDYMAFNFADPAHPRPGLDEDGREVDQGIHPIFGDIRVRRAMQLGIDVREIIEVAFQGNAMPIPANLPPTSWAYNADLAPTPYDPGTASRLLDEAGWRDINGDGYRECYGCRYADEGTSLTINLAVLDDYERNLVASVMQTQLARIGVRLASYPMYDYDQTYDAFLGGFDSQTSIYGRDPDQSLLFTRAGDALTRFGNVGSYNDPQIEQLFVEARSIPTCDVTQRAAVYRQIQSILQDQQPAVWLYARNDMVAARGIENFAPRPDNPLWNISQWVVHDEP